ncbi:VCBS repeat-containing protein [Aquimarina agarivorans]|uniref:VCBS repeat-containing protein n=1 Tax=Aquimarina agarivorans TaxID=980584 RepID=UPI000248FC73|nr:VCBS repeat-containing protein [Aquimarina agarivorans]
MISLSEKWIRLFFLSLVFNVCFCCKNKSTKQHSISKTKQSLLFQSIPASVSNINFVNVLKESEDANYFKYIYLYMGGGVAAGDINNDGLIDLYFTSNLAKDKLYLNKGNFVFEDITAKSGIKHLDDFHTGVTMADINNDGFLDIYVSRGGWNEKGDHFANMLYLNNGNETFSESAVEYGLADENRSIQATFFDYDNDNDLDVYVSNAPMGKVRSSVLPLNYFYKNPSTLKLKGSDRFYENDGTGHFEDVSEKVGLVYDVGFGLNPQVGDLNNDGFLDIYVSNDFNAPDLAYINNGDKTFTESGKTYFKHMSFNSMGSDISDLNNDGLPDLVTLDMNPQDYVRSKTTMAMTPLDKFENMAKNGYHYQYMHNMLHLNNGNGTFSETGNMAGIANTDWSWSVLAADFDLDGYKDLYITNGVFRDVIDRDKNNEIEKLLRSYGREPEPEDQLKFAQMLPQQKLKNYFFKNNGNTTFENTTLAWNDPRASFSNGATYADLDNDGDLDIVINNINDPATMLKNNAVELKKGKFLKIDFKGPKNNTNGVGAKVIVYFTDGTFQVQQAINSKGYLSSVSSGLYFGFQKNKEIDQIKIIWPDKKTQSLEKVTANQQLQVVYANAKNNSPVNEESTAMFSKLVFDASHSDPYFNDYDYQVLLPHKLSNTGPFSASSDVNGDGHMDLFIGGGKNQAATLFLGDSNGHFVPKKNKAFINDSGFEDQSAVFFDADQDGDHDLYVVSGSYEFVGSTTFLQDRLYLNDGEGNFERNLDALPQINSAGSVVTPSDYDQDGDIDLFVGGRVKPKKYPHPPTSYLLENEGGKFKEVTKKMAENLQHIGMVTDAVWKDIDNDNLPDLIVTGEWMGIEVFINSNGKFVKSAVYKTLSDTTGWWNKLLVEDVDTDGDLDIIAGNLGLNHKFKASNSHPFRIYTEDFDKNGSQDVLLSKEYKGKQVPIRGKTCMTQQLPYLKNRIGSYQDFASRDLQSILGKQLNQSLQYDVTEFRSGIFLNNGDNNFKFKPFILNAQQAPINSIVYQDLNFDGIKDLLLAGNNHQVEVETTRSDAGISTLLLGTKKGTFKYVSNAKTGLYLDKDIRAMETIETADKLFLISINNNTDHELYVVNKDNDK